MISRNLFCCFFLLLISAAAAAQEQPPAVQPVAKLFVKNITVKGNRKTKDYVILREVQFKAGDSVLTAALTTEFEKARQQVYNTTLFDDVKISANVLSAYDIDVEVEVKERWYIFPVPQFQLVDRNLNEWLGTYKGDLRRVNYGLKFIHYNLSGRRDQLRLLVLNGFTRNYSFSYISPGSNPSMTEGFSLAGGYLRNKQVAYTTSYDNVLQFFASPPSDSSSKIPGSFVRSNWYFTAGYIMRRGILNRHLITVGYNHFAVSDTVAKPGLNPNYLGGGRAAAGYVDIIYTLQHINVDNALYPLKGLRYKVVVQKRGLGLTGGFNMLSVQGTANRHWHLGGTWYSDLFADVRVKLPFDQPYLNQRAMGYDDTYLRGLEYKVIDGVAYGMLRSTLKKKLFGFNIKLPIKSKAFNRIPFMFFAKTYADMGYVYTKKKYDTYLNNRLLYTGGFGIDVLTLYDVSLRFEYGFNQLGQKGLFLHAQTGF